MITDENFIDFKCPHCEEAVSFPQREAGLARACPNCTETLIVPEDGAEMGRKLPLPITTERLQIRRFAPADWKDLLEFMSDGELFQYTAGGPLEEDDVLRWIETDQQTRLTTPDQMFYLGIEFKEAGKLVGFAGLRLVEPHEAGLHVILSRSFQRKGIAREAINAILGFCFEGIKLHRVTARCDSRNAAACKLFEAAGMRREGEFVKDTLSPDGWLSSVWFAALEEDYPAG